MSPIRPLLVSLAFAILAPAALAQDPSSSSSSSSPSQPAPAAQPAPSAAPALDDPAALQAELLRQMTGQGGTVMTPTGRPRRRAPRFDAGGAPSNQELDAMRPGVASPPDIAAPTLTSADGIVTCNQQLTEEQRAANRAEAQAMTDTINRMAELATRMSVLQAQQNGGRAAIAAMNGMMPRVDARVIDAFERMLNCAEQRLAAEATERAIAAPPGTSVAWRSGSRPNVSGTSTVIAVEDAAADGSQCLTVTDVIIVDGAETRAPKRMCRIPPSTRYVRT